MQSDGGHTESHLHAASIASPHVGLQQLGLWPPRQGSVPLNPPVHAGANDSWLLSALFPPVQVKAPQAVSYTAEAM